MKLFQITILALLFFSPIKVFAEIGTWTETEDCPGRYHTSANASWESLFKWVTTYSLVITGGQVPRKPVTIHSSGWSASGFPHICIEDITQPNVKAHLYCNYAECQTAHPHDHTTIERDPKADSQAMGFRFDDNYAIDPQTTEIIAPDCILKPVDLYFANGINNNQEDATNHLKKFQIKVEKKLDEQNIVNDSEEHPSCGDIRFKTLYHDHTFEEFVSGKLKNENRPVEDYYDQDAFDQGYSHVVPELIDPVDIVAQVEAMNSARGGQQVTKIIVAHSLGNKTANKVYELSTTKPKIIAFATPEGNVADGSTHITYNHDLVIHPLASAAKILSGQDAPLPGNTESTVELFDSQHTVESYLKKGSAGRQALCDRLDLDLSEPGIVGPIP